MVSALVLSVAGGGEKWAHLQSCTWPSCVVPCSKYTHTCGIEGKKEKKKRKGKQHFMMRLHKNYIKPKNHYTKWLY